MSRKKKQVANIDDRSRYFKLMIYEDNPKQWAVLQNVQTTADLFDRQTKWEYIAIKHNGYDDAKDHYHLYFAFEHPMRTVALCRRFGYFDDAGLPDDQFLRVISGRFDDALCYLTHRNTPEKEQYKTSELFGSAALIEQYKKAELEYLSRNVDKREAFKRVSAWIDAQEGIISGRAMVVYLLQNECFVIRHERWLYTLWKEHNTRLAFRAKQLINDAIAIDAEKWADILKDINNEAQIMPDEWFDLNGGGMF